MAAPKKTSARKPSAKKAAPARPKRAAPAKKAAEPAPPAAVTPAPPRPAPAPVWAPAPPPPAPVRSPPPAPFPRQAAPAAAPPARPRMDAAQERQYAMFLHLSALGGFVVGFLFFLGPLIMWLIKKDESAFVDRHGRAAMDFFLSIVIYALVAGAILGAIAVATLGLGVLLLIPLIVVAGFALGAALIVLPILAALKAQKGDEWHYPLAIRFLSKGAPAAAPPAPPPGSWPPAPPPGRSGP